MIRKLTGRLWSYGLAVALSGNVSMAAADAEKPEAVELGAVLHPGSDDTLAFLPDGNTVFFDRSVGNTKTILVAHRVNSHWMAPETASFSGHWFDQNPVVSPDGSYVLFDSDRPIVPGGRPLIQSYFGRSMPGSNVWRANRKADGWSEPIRLSATVNAMPFTDSPSIAGDGSLYFMWFDQGATHIFRSQFKNGIYLAPVRQVLGDPAITTHDPAVAPDESFMVFDYGKVKGGLGRLCIVFHKADQWSQPVDMGDVVNQDIPWGAHLAPDQRTVYVTGASNIWSIALAPWLQSTR